MPPILGGRLARPSYFALALAFAFALASALAFCLAVMGRQALGLTFTRLPLTVWYLTFGFLSGQSGSFFLGLEAGLDPAGALVAVAVVVTGATTGAAGAGGGGGGGAFPLGRIGVPVPPTMNAPTPGAATRLSGLPPSTD